MTTLPTQDAAVTAEEAKAAASILASWCPADRRGPFDVVMRYIEQTSRATRLAAAPKGWSLDQKQAIARRVLGSVDDVSLLTGVRIVDEVLISLGAAPAASSPEVADERAALHTTLPSSKLIAQTLERPPQGTTVCPLCGWNYPHEHTPREITIYRNGIKWGVRNGGQPWPWPCNSSAAEDGEADAGATGAARWAGAHQHHEHRAGQADSHGAHDQCDSRRDGLPSRGSVSSEVVSGVAAPAGASERYSWTVDGMEPDEGGAWVRSDATGTELLESANRRLSGAPAVAAADEGRGAARYWWLRDVGDATWRPFGIRAGYSAAQADAAIDAAMAASQDEHQEKQG